MTRRRPAHTRPRLFLPYYEECKVKTIIIIIATIIMIVSIIILIKIIILVLMIFTRLF